MVGSNYDTWFESPRIWFETTGYGASFSGARKDGQNGFAPQTGLNEFGLAFVTLATATPENGIPPSNKKRIENRTNYLKDILHKCKTTDEVKEYIDKLIGSKLNLIDSNFIDQYKRRQCYLRFILQFNFLSRNLALLKIYFNSSDRFNRFIFF